MIDFIKKHIANVLTVLRLLMTPIFIFMFLYGQYVNALIMFSLASITDFLDGKLARMYNVSNFGKIADSLADKFLVGGALVVFSLFPKGGLIPTWMVVVILFREVMVTVLRSIFIARYGKVVPSNIWGKLKTNTQMVAVIIVLIMFAFRELRPGIEQLALHLQGPYGSVFLMMCIPLICTVASGGQFLWSNRRALSGLLGSN